MEVSEAKWIDFSESKSIESVLALKTKRPEFRIIWF
jgi:hypothetical protein